MQIIILNMVPIFLMSYLHLKKKKKKKTNLKPQQSAAPFSKLCQSKLN